MPIGQLWVLLLLPLSFYNSKLLNVQVSGFQHTGTCSQPLSSSFRQHKLQQPPVFKSCITSSSSFTPTTKTKQQPTRLKSIIGTPIGVDINTNMNEIEEQTRLVAFWMASFSLSHIGMSAIRDKLIQSCGTFASSINIVNRDFMKLPSYWPGDDVGKNNILPDEDTAGRQIYRIGYTFVSFFTLGMALSAYLSTLPSSSSNPVVVLSEFEYGLCFWIAVSSFAASIASLFNASPLSLMPGFEASSSPAASSTEIDNDSSSAILGVVRRNDSIKFEPRGLTRITRHPLILPVVPWGIATSFLVGGNTVDFCLFGGLGLYALAGCAAQDLRVIRKEGSVGTVFRPYSADSVVDNGGSGKSSSRLEEFFQSTSYIPFGAVLDGRQSFVDVLKEFPWLPFLLVGYPAGTLLERVLLEFLQ